MLGLAFAVALSACQTPFNGALLHRSTEPEPASLAVKPAPDAGSRTERIAALLVRHAPDLAPVDRARVAEAIVSAQRAHHVDPLLLLAVIEQESRFQPRATGPHGSIGLMQIKPFVARDIARRHDIPWSGPRTLLDPAANVEIGACYLGEMLEMYPDTARAIAAYNLGPYRVQRLVARGHEPRTRYLSAVLARFQVFASEFGPAEAEPAEDANAE